MPGLVAAQLRNKALCALTFLGIDIARLSYTHAVFAWMLSLPQIAVCLYSVSGLPRDPLTHFHGHLIFATTRRSDWPSFFIATTS
jgi:hypothetical protein